MILQVETYTVDMGNPLINVLTNFKPGDTITIKLIRGGARHEVSVTLGTR